MRMLRRKLHVNNSIIFLYIQLNELLTVNLHKKK